MTKEWKLPPLSLLSPIPRYKKDTEAADTAKILQQVLKDFHVNATVAKYFSSPQTMTFYISPDRGVRIQDVIDLKYDFIRAFHDYTENFVFTPVIPGTSYMSLTIPKKKLSNIYIRQLIESKEFTNNSDNLAVPIGIDGLGNPVIESIYKFPHILLSGSVAAGKTTLIHSWICSLLMRNTPDDVRFVLMDFLRVEFYEYNGIPHLLTNVILDPDKGLSALRWVSAEMENRYKQFVEAGTRNIAAYNELAGFQKMPYIIVVIDEFSDLMAFAPKEVEDLVCRLAQMARATGIHMIIATQRPAVDVLPGVLVANFPTRIVGNVSSATDSQWLLYQDGAEKLNGLGDMLYMSSDQAKLIRIQAPLITEKEIVNITKFLKKQIQRTPVPLPDDL